MTFRAATRLDIDLLHGWRTVAERKPWYVGKVTLKASHMSWLLPRLRDSLVQVRIWEELGEPVGMVRVDSNGELAFHANSSKVAARMLKAALPYSKLHGRLKAAVDPEDVEKCGQLLMAGFVECPVRFFVYKDAA